MLTKTSSVVEMMRYIAADIASELSITVHYEHGSRMNIDKALQDYSKSAATQAVKFPLLALIQPLSEKATDDSRLKCEVSLRLVLATLSDPKWTPDEREARSFVSVLRPMLAQLKTTIRKSGYFYGTSYGTIDMDSTEIYMWGEQGGTVFADYVDAILIENLNLKVRNLTSIC